MNEFVNKIESKAHDDNNQLSSVEVEVQAERSAVLRAYLEYPRFLNLNVNVIF